MTGAQSMEVPSSPRRRATRLDSEVLGDHAPALRCLGNGNVWAFRDHQELRQFGSRHARTSPTARPVVDRQWMSSSTRWVSAPTARPDLIADSDLDISGTGTKSCAGRARLGTSYLPADYERPSASSAFVLQSSGIESLFERTFLEIPRRGRHALF